MKPTGLFFTGGVESTLLLHTLSTRVKTLQLYTVLNFYIDMERIKTIINYVNDKNNTTHNYLFTIPLKDPIHDTEKTFVRWARHLAEVELDKLYIGSNEYKDNIPEREYLIHNNIVLPFKGVQKDKIVEFYIKNDLIELLRLTHSCFRETAKHCGYCPGCIERKWAFERNFI